MKSPLYTLLPQEWKDFLSPFYDFTRFSAIQDMLENEADNGKQIFPPENKIFAAFNSTFPQNVKAVILGQDPYHDDGQACGLAFAVPEGIKPPPSLKNILKEWYNDQGIQPATFDISAWSRHGVLLLNTALTVRAHAAASHKGKGWEEFTDAVISALAAQNRPIGFILWGTDALKKKALLAGSSHPVVESVHPSPLSAYRGFFGSKPFSTLNSMLLEKGGSPVDWSLKD